MLRRAQEFGFVMENQVRGAFGLAPNVNDTAAHDITAEENPLNHNETVSIKTVCEKGSLCLGDALRVFNYDATLIHTMIVLPYMQLADTRRIKEVIEMNWNTEFHTALFGTATREEITALDTYIKSIPAGGRTAEHRATYKQMAAALKARSGGWVTYNPKVDSKAKRRLQCSISNLRGFLATYPQFISARNTAPVVRGQPIVAEHPFGRRVFNVA